MDMNKTKTVAIMSVVVIAMLGVIIYALRDNLSEKKTTTQVPTTKKEEVA